VLPMVPLAVGMFGAYVAIIGACHFAALRFFGTRAWFSAKTSSKQSAIAQAAINIGLAGSLCCMYASALGQLDSAALLADSGVETRMFGSPISAALIMEALRLNLAMVLYECYFYYVHGKGLDLWAHHILGTGVLLLALHGGQCATYIAWAGISEGTTVFLGARTLLLESGLSAHPLYVVNGAFLWLSFLGLRVLMLAACAWRLARDIFIVPTSALSARFEVDAHLMLRHVLLWSCAFIWALSTFWFGKITMGLLAVIFPRAKKDS